MIVAAVLKPYIQVGMSAKRVVGIIEAQSIIIVRLIDTKLYAVLVVDTIHVFVIFNKLGVATRLLYIHIVGLQRGVKHNLLYLTKQLFLFCREFELGILAIAYGAIRAIDIKVCI